MIALNESLTIEGLNKIIENILSSDDQESINQIDHLINILETFKSVAKIKKDQVIVKMLSKTTETKLKAPEDETKYHGDIEWLMDYLGVSRQTVYGYNTARKFPIAYRKGKKNFYNKEEIRKLVESTGKLSADQGRAEALKGLVKIKKAS